MASYSISCASCKARLKVRDESAVGEIHTCPRCGSMVLVTPPRTASPDAPLVGGGDGKATTAATGGAASLLDLTFDDAVEILNPTAPPPMPRATPHGGSALRAPKRVDLWADTVDEVPSPTAAESQTAAATAMAELNAPPCALPTSAADLADTIDSEEGPAELATADSPPAAQAAATQLAGEPLIPTDAWVSPAVRIWRQWVLLGGAATAGVALAVGVFGYAVRHATRTSSPAVAASAAPGDRAAAGEEQPAWNAPGDSVLRAAPDETNDADPGQNTVTDDGRAPETGRRANDGGQPASTPASPASEEASPPPPVADAPLSPFAAPDAPAPPTHVAANGDLLEKFGDFLGNAPYASPAPADEAPAAAEDTPEPSAAGSEPAIAEVTPLPRPLPRLVDVPARLSDPIVEIELASMPLVEFLALVSDLSTIPITLDPAALAWRRLTPAAPVSVHQSETTVGEVLTAAISPLKLAFAVEEGQLLVTGLGGGEELRQIRHPVEDLTGGDPARTAELAALVVRLVAPDRWKSAGGAGSLEVNDGALVIEQTEAVHLRTIVFCETLRVARGLAPRTRFDAALFRPEARRQAIRAKLASPITLNYRQPTKLTEILGAFGKTAGASILVDWRAAAEAGWSPDATGSVVGNGDPLADALARLLTPMDLTYRAIDAATLEVTTPEALRAEIQTDFYSVTDLLSPTLTERALQERIRAEVGESHFGEGRGALHYDAASKHLIAALPQPQLDAVAALLDSLRSR